MIWTFRDFSCNFVHFTKKVKEKKVWVCLTRKKKHKTYKKISHKIFTESPQWGLIGPEKKGVWICWVCAYHRMCCPLSVIGRKALSHPLRISFQDNAFGLGFDILCTICTTQIKWIGVKWKEAKQQWSAIVCHNLSTRAILKDIAHWHKNSLKSELITWNRTFTFLYRYATELYRGMGPVFPGALSQDLHACIWVFNVWL